MIKLIAKNQTQSLKIQSLIKVWANLLKKIKGKNKR